MKRILLSLVLVSTLSFNARAQDAAVEERLNKLSGQIEDLLAAKAEQDKRLATMAKEIETLREQGAKAQGNTAGQEEVRKLAEAIQKVDQKRVDDNEHILKELEKLGKTVSTRPPRNTAPPKETAGDTEKPEKGFDYVVKSGDTLSAIVSAYREQGVKVTVDQVLKANPGLKAESMKVGQKIFIPKP
ncbi:MAG: LysM peptidoglycan-binding domain-containing protein [Verrucomicrobia bacterium]|nr:MAG: LysM peptidoglycan-binding domain-containing protein [Verrucomicrobiota bacterium]